MWRNRIRRLRRKRKRLRKKWRREIQGWDRGRKCKGEENVNFEQSLAVVVQPGRVVD